MRATHDLYKILADPTWFELYPEGRIGEPGTASIRKTLAIASHRNVRHIKSAVKDYIVGYKARDFRTIVPNVDIRHGENFTGQRRGKKRRFSLEPWGTISDILNV